MRLCRGGVGVGVDVRVVHAGVVGSVGQGDEGKFGVGHGRFVAAVERPQCCEWTSRQARNESLFLEGAFLCSELSPSQ